MDRIKSYRRDVLGTAVQERPPFRGDLQYLIEVTQLRAKTPGFCSGPGG